MRINGSQKFTDIINIVIYMSPQYVIYCGVVIACMTLKAVKYATMHYSTFGPELYKKRGPLMICAFANVHIFI